MSIRQRVWNQVCWVHTEDKDVIYTGNHMIPVNKTSQAQNDAMTFAKTGDVNDALLIFGQTPNKIRTGFSIRKMFQGYLSDFNIWDRELTDGEMKRLRSCQGGEKGNFVQWARDNLNITGGEPNIALVNIEDMSSLCKKKTFFVIPHDVSLRVAFKQCQALGGQIAVPENDEENDKVVDLVSEFKQCFDNPNSIAWIGIEKMKQTSKSQFQLGKILQQYNITYNIRLSNLSRIIFS